jgi:hypothetical protein
MQKFAQFKGYAIMPEASRCTIEKAQRALQRFHNQHLNSPAHTPVHECDDCDMTFGSRQSLNQHLTPLSTSSNAAIVIDPSEADKLSRSTSSHLLTFDSEQSEKR